MEWICQRYSDDGNSTLGLLFKVINVAGKDNLHFFCDTLEDEFREVKVMHETRIPAGRYKLQILKIDTPLTLRHRKSYNKGYKTEWFKYHVHIMDVPGFTGIYVHSGNLESHTSGCLLLGFGSQKINGMQSINNSRLAVKAWYDVVYDHLDSGGESWIEFRDENKLL